jgi:hypothetical protein
VIGAEVGHIAMWPALDGQDDARVGTSRSADFLASRSTHELDAELLKGGTKSRGHIVMWLVGQGHTTMWPTTVSWWIWLQ